ncbi:MAG: pseudouridine synthase [Rhizobiaceae bacterium]|nr:pseudouridine synthase [Rhizobiaceae bacterium]MCV0406158.1 pseudouridine synthase [Rhizobiaceae bacterium]
MNDDSKNGRRPRKPGGKGGKPFAGNDRPRHGKPGAPAGANAGRDRFRVGPPRSGGLTDSAPRGKPVPAAAAREPERIAKWLSRAGVASRRDAEEMIAAGRVSINGKVIDTPAVKVGASDQVSLDDAAVTPPERTRLFLFHKPAGLVTTNRDPEGRRTIFDALPEGLPRLLTIGRLDINTEGLLLLTNDGGLARVLELPSTGWLRRYRVRVHGKVDPAALEGLKDGIAVDGVYYGAIEASLDREQGSNAWLTLGLREGKNREVRNVLGALGLEVTRLIRVSYGPFQLGELAEGAVQEIKGRMLRDQLGERLIAEAGADFESDIAKPFSNRPTRAGDAPAQKDKPARAAPQNRKRERESRREDALGRLDTRPRGERPPRPDRTDRTDREGRPPRAGREDRSGRERPEGDRASRPRRRVLEDVSRGGTPEEQAASRPFRKPFRAEGSKGRPAERRDRYEPPRSRSSNVWMAPGARPPRKPREEDAGHEEGSAPKSSSPSSRRPREEGRAGAGEGRRQGEGRDGPRRERPDRRPNAKPSGSSRPRGGRPGGPRRGPGKD